MEGSIFPESYPKQLGMFYPLMAEVVAGVCPSRWCVPSSLFFWQGSYVWQVCVSSLAQILFCLKTYHSVAIFLPVLIDVLYP